MRRIIRTSSILWTVQALLAALFLFAGGVKLVLPPEAMAGGPITLPILFIRFIGICEVLGAIGLIVPQWSGIRPALTPLAAAGLVIIMIGATTITIATGPVASAILPCVAGLLAATVAYGRWPAPLRLQATA